MSMDERIKPGCIAKCSKGIIGVVERRGVSKFDGSEMWIGTSTEGKPWGSRNPTLVAENVGDYLAGRLVDTTARQE